MHRSTKTQVTHHGNAQTIKTSLPLRQFASNGEQIKQGLTGMLIGAVATIDYRHTTGRSKFAY